MSTNEKTHWRVVTPATWPAPPAVMSVSTYAEIEECPRRWALSSAEYPELWGGRGYPPKLQVAALAGSVVHLALEIIMKQLMRAGVPSLSDPSAPQVLRELGGYTRVVEECVARILKRYIDNPRASALMEHAQRALRGQVPTLRVRVQSILSRLRLPNSAPPAPAASAPKSGGPPPRLPLVNGIYPEVEVHAKSIGWKGKIDLLVLGDDACQITDFKTGATDEAHKFQVRTYAVMWRLDDELNPSGRVVDRLVLAYENQDVDVAPPITSEIDEISRELRARRQAAEAALAARPPSARPNTESCRYCGVRQLCDTYWASATQVVSDDGRYGDIELKITGRHGPTSWDAVVVRARDLPAKMPALLRVQQPGEFKKGARVRVLDGALAHDSEDDAAPAIVTLGVLSEAYYEPLGDRK
ncbi:PD-(D/E)XK nuclease family protein [Pseudomonas aeruginosa]|uniref:PD-(D/E)XK endonuclease-like domain-containing protein n=1 Tax=Castellaniella daejeonensis TaxID=659013 RepID=A0ABN0TAK5_9BURK|nr:PD-(D/E)XK nuclease family protein [Pseudomonas aeruginosa]